ncbi:MAG: peptidase T [Lachnospiraceae bacterium]|nr:peptidase T [Lachnospiraceae bacterium]
MTDLLTRFLKYASFDTQSAEEQEALPSTAKQFELAKYLKEELINIGATEVTMDAEHAYVYATIPATTDTDLPVLGFISHMDTSPAMSGKDVKPQLVKDYDGSDITLNKDLGIILSPADYPEMLKLKGKTIICTDGTTLLGADDKAGVAEIMTMAEYFLTHPEVKHGKIRIGFTPDEEVGRGVDFFDVDLFGADYAYTVDGGALGELEYENFNAAGGKVKVKGVSIHPGSAKGKMINACTVGMEFFELLPKFMNPACTEGYEGFFHLDSMQGSVEYAEFNYIIRDHDMKLFEEKKELFKKAADFINAKYGEGTLEAIVTDSYYNMKEMIEPNMHLIESAKEVMKDLGVTPIVSPIRGGTDGARLSFMGLPCPNLCTGGANYHGKFEYACLEDMNTCAEILKKLVLKYSES